MSVVIVTRDRADELVVALRRLRALPEQPPIVVVDNGSSDGTISTVRRVFPGVVLVPAGRNLGGAGRNLGVAAVRTPYVAFSDDDSWWEPGALTLAADVLDAAPRLAVVAAQVRVGPAGTVDPTCAAMACSPLPRAQDLPGPSVLGFIACGAVVRARPFLAAGGFDELFGVGGEESMLAFDLAGAGWGLSYVDRVVARHEPSPVRDREARRRRVIRNDLWLRWLRRSRSDAAAFTWRTLRRAVHDRTTRDALGDALRGLPAVAPRRRPMPSWLEQQVRLLEAVGATAGPHPGDIGRRAQARPLSSTSS